MTTRYNVNHKAKYGRGNSRYKERLEARGLAYSPVMRDYVGRRGDPAQSDKYAPGGRPRRR